MFHCESPLRNEADPTIDPAAAVFKRFGLPYGEKPRLVMIYLAIEAVRTGNPEVAVEESMTVFARSLGLETNGQQLRALKEQLARAAGTVRTGVMEEGKAISVNAQIVGAFDLWFAKQPDQRVFWPSTVRLSQEYFQTLGQHAVPLEHWEAAVLASSSMALDLSVCLAQSRQLSDHHSKGFLGRVNIVDLRIFLPAEHSLQVNLLLPAARSRTSRSWFRLRRSPQN